MHRRSNAAGPVATGSLDQPRSPLAVTGAAPDPNARRASPGNLTTPTRADATSYATGSSVSGVQRQLLLPLVLPHLRMLPAILRMIVPAVSDESRAGGTHGREPAARRFTLDRKHAAARGVLRSRVRQSAASRESSWTARTPPSKPDRKAHNCYRSRRAGGVSPVEAALPPVGHLHDAPPTAPVHPTATCRVVARADRCSRCSPVRYVTV